MTLLFSPFTLAFLYLIRNLGLSPSFWEEYTFPTLMLYLLLHPSHLKKPREYPSESENRPSLCPSCLFYPGRPWTWESDSFISGASGITQSYAIRPGKGSTSTAQYSAKETTQFSEKEMRNYVRSLFSKMNSKYSDSDDYFVNQQLTVNSIKTILLKH